MENLTHEEPTRKRKAYPKSRSRACAHCKTVRVAGLAETYSASPCDFQYQEMGSKKESLGTLEPILKTGPLPSLKTGLNAA